MDDSAPKDVLGMKAQAALRAQEARGMSPSKALRRALSQTADHLWDLALVVQKIGVEVLDQNGVVALLTDDDLLILLDGPGGALGLATLDRQALTALVEVQTIQQVTMMPPEERTLTATDAAMMAPMIDETLARFAENLNEHLMRSQLDGFAFGARIEDRRAVGLMLDAPGYRAFGCEVDLALGRRRGIIRFVFPEHPTTPAQKNQGAGTGPHADLFARLPARLDGILARVTLPLCEAELLRPGDILDLPASAVDMVELVAGGDTLVARGRLGHKNGARAIRLNWPSRPQNGAEGAVSDLGKGLSEPPENVDAQRPDAETYASPLLAPEDPSPAPMPETGLETATLEEDAQEVGEPEAFEASEFDFSLNPMEIDVD